MSKDPGQYLTPEEQRFFKEEMTRAGEQNEPPEEAVEPHIPPRPKRRRRKSKFVAGLLAAVLPGTGHIYLGLLRKGVSVIFLILLDIAAMLYFSSIGMQINVPLLILLALLIPAVYFYNVYDALQSADRILRYGEMDEAAEFPDDALPRKRRFRVTEPGLSFGLLLLFGGGLLFLFRSKPPWLQSFIEQYAGAAVSALLICGGFLIGLREVVRTLLLHKKDEMRTRRVGRYTAAAVLAAVGVLLLLDWREGAEHMLLLLEWWPAVPVLWGLEYLLVYLFAHRSKETIRGSRFRLDLRGLLPALLLAASVFIVAEQQHYLHLWNKVSMNLTAAAVDYGEAEGSRFVKPVLTVPVELHTAKIVIDAINGDILLHRGPVEDIEVTAAVWVDQLEGPMAEAISEQSFIDVSQGPTIKLTPKSKAYGESGKRQPRMNLDVVLPEDRRFNLEIRTMNGDITLQNVEAIQDISLETGNGQLILHRIYGNVKGSTLNGAVKVRSAQGNVELSTNGGDMNAWEVSGALQMSTGVGNIGVTGAASDIGVSTKNGNVQISEVHSELRAESLNGGIEVRSPVVGGDWDIYSAVGDIQLYLPEEGDYTLKGSSGYGNIQSGLPFLVIDKKSVSGENGTGEFSIKADGNSNLNVMKY